MTLNIKRYQVPSGSLLRLKEPVWCSNDDPPRDRVLHPLPRGTLAMVVEHPYPAMLKVLAGGEMTCFDFRGRVPIHGSVLELELVSLPAGSALQEWSHFRGE